MDVRTKVGRQVISESMYFEDKIRRIDMILVYEEEDKTKIQLEKRTKFEEQLKKQGLNLEFDQKLDSNNSKTTFVKVHAPWKVLTKYAEMLSLKMPIKKFTCISFGKTYHTVPQSRYIKSADREPKKGSLMDRVSKLFDYDQHKIPPDPDFFSIGFLKDKEDKFIVKDRETFFSSAQRSQIVWQILLRTKYDDDTPEMVGIVRLLNKEIYCAAFPLHEGPLESKPNQPQTDRQLLFSEWAHIGNFYKRQPLWLVKKYFGDKIGLYFAWLGFYNQMLIPPALGGLFVFLYGCATVNADTYNVASYEICGNGPDSIGQLKMCPDCETFCPFRDLAESCYLSRLSYIFDNWTTVFFALFMSLWAALFIEIWKRRQSVIAWKWDLEMDDTLEQARPEFEAKVKTARVNPLTKVHEAYMPAWNKSSRIALTTSLVIFMLVAVLGSVVAVIFYRIVVLKTIFRIANEGESFFSKARIVASGTAATLNLIFIVILNKLYEYVALWLVNYERPRTQSEFERSFTFKMFFFQCINFYSSIIYIAFFKGKFFRHPGEASGDSLTPAAFENDKCDAVGCWYELSIQLFFIMFGKQIFNNIVEIILPKLVHFWKLYVYNNSFNCQANGKKQIWEEDYNLQAWGQLALFEEYLEMVVQYGFVTLFVAAFPLAPLFALINNIFEIRIDAHKLLVQIRRPVAQKAQDIGAWVGILQTISYFAIVTNALVIAVTSDFIPRYVYVMQYNTQKGFTRWQMTAFNTSFWTMGPNSTEWPGPESFKNSTDINNFTCYFRAMRKEGPKFELRDEYYFVFMMKLAFVILFEHLVFGLVGLIGACISDTPENIRIQIQREKMVAREALFESEMSEQLGQSFNSSSNPIQSSSASPQSFNNQTTFRRGSRVVVTAAEPYTISGSRTAASRPKGSWDMDLDNFS